MSGDRLPADPPPTLGDATHEGTHLDDIFAPTREHTSELTVTDIAARLGDEELRRRVVCARGIDSKKRVCERERETGWLERERDRESVCVRVRACARARVCEKAPLLSLTLAQWPRVCLRMRVFEHKRARERTDR